MAIDLSNYDVGELKGLLFDIDQECKRRQRGELDDARARIHALAQDAGLSVEQLLAPGGKGAAGAAQGVARYRNPDDAGQTWSGRGRQPKWLVAGLAAGRALADFAV